MKQILGKHRGKTQKLTLDSEKIGQRLREVRRMNNLTQTAMASELNISTRCYMNYDQGHREVTSRVLLAMHQRFGVNPIWILTGKGTPPTHWARIVTRQDDDGINEVTYAAACKMAFSTGNASACFVQRKLNLRWADASAIINRMEGDGFISGEGLGGKRIVYDAEPARSMYRETAREHIERVLAGANDEPE